MMLMFMVQNKEYRKKVLDQIMRDKKYQQVADTAVKRYKNQDMLIKKRQEDEARRREEERADGAEPEDQKQDEGAADAEVGRVGDENSEEESERSEEENEFST